MGHELSVGRRCGTGIIPHLVALGVLLPIGAGSVMAADKETRAYHIYVDNKHVGSYRTDIEKQENGAVLMTGKASLRVKYLVYSYSYAYDGTETWKNGRLMAFTSRTNDNGKKYEVVAGAEQNGLRVTVNGRQRTTGADVWLTSYWRLPASHGENQPVALLDADTGKDIAGHLKSVGLEMVTVAGQQMKCKHYRVTGTPAPVELWYDDRGLLVRQSTVEQGHQTLIHLAGVTR